MASPAPPMVPPAPQLPPGMNLDSVFGAAFLGNIVAAIFFGITCVQTFIYYLNSYKKDTVGFRLLILALWIMDGLQLAFVTHGVYFYLVSSFGDFVAIAFPTWSVLGQVYITCLSDLFIRCVFARRVWLMTKGNKILMAGIVLTSAATVVIGYVFTSRAFAERTFANFSKISYLLYGSLGSAVAADILIAGSLCAALAKSRTGFRKTDTIVNVLIIYTINTSLLTTVCFAACLVTYAIWPDQFIFIGIYFCLSKLYLNSLLATLNGRQSLLDKVQGVSNISDVSSSSRRVQLFPKESQYGSSIRGQGPVVVSINRSVDIEGQSQESPLDKLGPDASGWHMLTSMK